MMIHRIGIKKVNKLSPSFLPEKSEIEYYSNCIMIKTISYKPIRKDCFLLIRKFFLLLLTIIIALPPFQSTKTARAEDPSFAPIISPSGDITETYNEGDHITYSGTISPFIEEFTYCDFDISDVPSSTIFNNANYSCDHETGDWSFDWTPTTDQGGLEYNFFLYAMYNDEGAAKFFHLTINDTENAYPSIVLKYPTNTIGTEATIKEGESIKITVFGYEYNSTTPITVGVEDAPTGSLLIPVSISSPVPNEYKSFLWRPDYQDAGTWLLNFYASDGDLTTYQIFTLTVTDIPEPIEEEKGADGVLMLVNQNSPDSVALGKYYQERRGVPANQIISLDITTDEGITLDTYNSQLRDPIRSYLTDNGLRTKIGYIVPTYGIPSQIFSTQQLLDNFKQMRIDKTEDVYPDYAVDSFLADLFNDSTSRLVNPYYRGNEITHTTGIHDSPKHFSSDYGTYLVTRLDGTSLKIAKGLVDKAIYAGRYTGPFNNNIAYVYKQHYLDNDQEVICEVMERAGYLCKTASSYPYYDRGYDPKSPTKMLGGDLGGANPLWLVSPGNEYYDIWENWRPGAVPIHFQSFTSPFTIRDTKSWWESVVAHLLAADATATTGTVTEPYAAYLPQPTLFFDYFLNGDGSDEHHYNFAESIYLSTAALKWTNIVIGDPLYKLSDNPVEDTSAPKIKNISYTCSANKANISWNNLTAEDGSPEVSYGAINYGPTENLGTEVWDTTDLEYYGVSKKNYLSQHSFQINGIDCSKEYHFQLKAVDPKENMSHYSFAVNTPVEPTLAVAVVDNPVPSATTNTNPLATPQTNSTKTNSSIANSPSTLNSSDILRINIRSQSGGTELLSSEGGGSTIVESEPFVLSGTAPPNSIVEIEIHSDPIKFTTKADETGFWSISLDQLLSAGNHQVFIKIKDEINQIIAEASYSLTVKANAAESTQNQNVNKSLEDMISSDKVFFIYMGLMILFLILTFVIMIKNHRKSRFSSFSN